jgi:glycosyltransferase involved in cell wall biosynthesis
MSQSADPGTSSSSPAGAVTGAVPVLHVINGEFYSGAERVQDLLATALRAEGFEVGFACVKPGDFPCRRHDRRAPLHSLPMRSRLDLRVAVQLATVVREHGYRIVHAHTPRSALVGRLAALRAGVPFVYHVHSPTCRDSTQRLRNRLNSLIERLSLWRSNHLITVSSSLECHMRRLGYSPHTLTVVRNGVPASSVRRSPQRPEGEWMLGVVALFRPRKGLESLLEAIAILRNQDLPVRLRAIGGFESEHYRASLLERTQQLGIGDAIDWPGFCADVNCELAHLDLLVLPSLFGEGLPMVILEAMACGVPVVATRVEGVPEAVDDGVQGVLVRPQDAADLARGIARVVQGEMDWSALQRQAIAHHGAHFSDRSMAAGVAAVYRRALAQPRDVARSYSFRSAINAAARLVLRK